MPRQTNPDNASSPQEIGDRISPAVKRGPKALHKPRKPDSDRAGATKKKPGT